MKSKRIDTMIIPYGMFINAFTLNEQTLERIKQAASGAESGNGGYRTKPTI